MSNFSRKTKRYIEKNKVEQEERMTAVAGWLDTYQHKYPTFVELAEDPVLALVHFMQSHSISVVRAAELAEEYALTYNPTGEEDESETEQN